MPGQRCAAPRCPCLRQFGLLYGRRMALGGPIPFQQKQGEQGDAEQGQQKKAALDADGCHDCVGEVAITARACRKRERERERKRKGEKGRERVCECMRECVCVCVCYGGRRSSETCVSDGREPSPTYRRRERAREGHGESSSSHPGSASHTYIHTCMHAHHACNTSPSRLPYRARRSCRASLAHRPLNIHQFAEWRCAVVIA